MMRRRELEEDKSERVRSVNDAAASSLQPAFTSGTDSFRELPASAAEGFGHRSINPSPAGLDALSPEKPVWRSMGGSTAVLPAQSSADMGGLGDFSASFGGLSLGGGGGGGGAGAGGQGSKGLSLAQPRSSNKLDLGMAHALEHSFGQSSRFGGGSPPEWDGVYLEPFRHFYSDSNPRDLMLELEAALTSARVDTVAVDDEFQFKCESYAHCVKIVFVVQVYAAAAAAASSKYLVEVQRLCGDASAFADIYRAITAQLGDRGMINTRANQGTANPTPRRPMDAPELGSLDELSLAAPGLGLGLSARGGGGGGGWGGFDLGDDDDTSSASGSDDFSAYYTSEELEAKPPAEKKQQEKQEKESAASKDAFGPLLEMSTSPLIDVCAQAVCALADLSCVASNRKDLECNAVVDALASLVSKDAEDIHRPALTALANVLSSGSSSSGQLCSRFAARDGAADRVVELTSSGTPQVVREAARLLACVVSAVSRDSLDAREPMRRAMMELTLSEDPICRQHADAVLAAFAK